MWRGLKRRTGYGTPDRKRSRSPAGTDVSNDDEQFDAADEYDAAKDGGLGIGTNSQQVSAGPATVQQNVDPRLTGEPVSTTGYEPKMEYNHLLNQKYGDIDEATFHKFMEWQKQTAQNIITPKQNVPQATASIPPASYNSAGLPAPPYFGYQSAASIPPASVGSAGKPNLFLR